MAKSRAKEYFATLPMLSKEFAAACMDRYRGHLDDLKQSHRHERMRRAWHMYYSKARDGGWDDTEVMAAGPNGETTLIRPNEFRNLIQHQLNLVTQSPPGYECVAVNSDSDSFADAIRGNGILDYYLRVHHLDDIRVELAEIAIVLGEAHLHARWDAAAGNEYTVRPEPVMEDDGKTPKQKPVMAEDGETPQTDEAGQPVMEPEVSMVPVHEGEFTFSVNTPYDVAYDPMSRDRSRPRWVIICEPANRWDLAAQFPDQKEAILDAEPYSRHVANIDGVFCRAEYQHDDYIARYYVYIDKSPAVRTGREAMVLDDKTVLTDGPLSEDRIPSFRLAPSNVIFQSGGYTNNFDLMPLQEVYAAQYSTVLSNHTAWGKNWVTAPKGTNTKPYHLNRGLGLLEYENLPGSAPPQALNLLAPQGEHLTFLDIIRATMERYAVIPANMRGEGTKGDSGAKEALIHATAQQFASSFHRSLSRTDEDVGTHLIASLESHATTKRVATIVGRYSSYSSVEFTGKDLQKIARVTVRAADAGRDTPVGREMMAEKLMGFPDGIRSAEQYITFRETGRTEPMYEGTRDELMCIRRENEQLRDGKQVVFSKLDKHSLHIREHKGKTGDKATRENPQLMAAFEQHIAQHIAALDPTHPEFAGMQVLLTIGEQPLPMQQPAMPGDVPPPPANDNGKPPDGRPKAAANDQIGSAGAGAGGKPDMPQLPKNPATGERAPGAVPPPPPITQRAG